MITYLQLHPNMRWAVGVVLLLALAGTVTWLYWRFVYTADEEREAGGPGTRPLRVAGSSGWRGRFDSDSPQLRPDLPGRDMPAAAGEHHPTPDEWDHLDADTAAQVLIAEWHDDLPGPDHICGPETCGADFARDARDHGLWAEYQRDVWDAWWAGMDGLERECLKVTRLRQREQQLWAELVAETRELCGVAA